MTSDQVLANIRETNLSYMDLARKLIATDRPKALTQLGITDESATMLQTMSSHQITKVSSGSTLLCSVNISDDLVWGLVTGHRVAAANDVSVREYDCTYDSPHHALAKSFLSRVQMIETA